eukprot:6199243-Pleurochrysis_carterae.AAC.3
MTFDDTKTSEMPPMRSRSSRARLLLITPCSGRMRGNNGLTSLEQRVESRHPISGADNYRVACGRIRQSIWQKRTRQARGKEARRGKTAGGRRACDCAAQRVWPCRRT